jgi:RNA polymerase sigma-70 factor, ECF subfamily
MEATNHIAHAQTAQDELVRLLRDGDEAACEQLVRRHGGAMLAVARRYVRAEDEAQDVVQEAFLHAFRGIARFRAEAQLSTWLHRITVTCALMRLRSRRRRREGSIEDLLPNFAEDGRWAEAAGEGEDASPEESLGARQTRALVRQCIDELPDNYRSVVLLRDIDDLDTREVSAILGVTETAVKVRLHRARQALRTLIELRQRAERCEGLAARAS